MYDEQDLNRWMQKLYLMVLGGVIGATSTDFTDFWRWDVPGELKILSIGVLVVLYAGSEAYTKRQPINVHFYNAGERDE